MEMLDCQFASLGNNLQNGGVTYHIKVIMHTFLKRLQEIKANMHLLTK